MQVTFLVSMSLTFVGLFPFTQRCYNYIKRAKRDAPAGYDFPEFSDLKLSLIFMLIFFVTNFIWVRVVPPYLASFIKVQDDQKEIERRSKKAAL